MSEPKPTLIGHVAGVAGALLTVRQSADAASGLAIVGGKTYRIGQVGSFVRIPEGYQDLYGIITQVGVSPEASAAGIVTHLNRLISVQLVGEVVGGLFERGISQFPNIHDEVHFVTEEDLRDLYGVEEQGQIAVGRLANAESVTVKIDIDKLLTRHSAVLGSTGSGKSTTVASLVRSLVGATDEGVRFPSARILILDIHGEYSNALSDLSRIFRVNASEQEAELLVPFWAVDLNDLIRVLMGKLDDKVHSQVVEKIYDYKQERLAIQPEIAGASADALTSGSPVPFSISRLWCDLIKTEITTWSDAARTQSTEQDAGDLDTLTPPVFLPATANNSAPYQNLKILGIRRNLDQMRSRILDKQFGFLLSPGDWKPNKDGICGKDLGELLREWLGHERPVTILDLSGVPSEMIDALIGSILRVVYDALYWGREVPEGGRERPLMIVMEEAHRYLNPKAAGLATEMVQRIVKEGRKFGVGAMIVSQRPSEVDETVLSQCGTFIALRMANSTDRARVQSTLPDSLAGLMESLPVLRTGEAIITGEAAKLPIRCRVQLPPESQRPRSEDPEVAKRWSAALSVEDYERLAATWRAQDPLWKRD
jgi:DNA helicase HerA-like ATPase